MIEEACDETMFWMEIMEEADVVPKRLPGAVYAEANEILAITVASMNTAKTNRSS